MSNTLLHILHSIAQALLAPDTRIEDVFFGFYSWLDKHPTEAVLLSMNYESGTGTEDTEALQVHLYDIFQTELAKKYWVQTYGSVSDGPYCLVV